MNTRPPEHGDDRAPALAQAEDGSDAWRAVVHIQRVTEPEHGDLYAIAGDMVQTLRCLSSLAGLLSTQVATYGRGRVLRDDEPGHDPAERLAIASSWAAQLQHDLDHAERTANRFWSEVGHIAVEDPS